MGLLEGALQGNTWTFTPEQVGKLLNEPYVQGAIEAKRNAIWTGFLQDTGKQVPSLCTTADFPATDAQGGKRTAGPAPGAAPSRRADELLL